METANNDTIIEVQNLENFFNAEIASVVESRHIELADETTRYVSKMLASFSCSENLYKNERKGFYGVEPLAIIMAAAVDVPAQKRLVHLQRIGDVALFTTGFFVFRFDESCVNGTYFKERGASAYESLACETRSLDLFNLFRNLAKHFYLMVDILTEVRHQHEDVLQLHQVWLRTKSKWTERLLRQRGIVPIGK